MFRYLTPYVSFIGRLSFRRAIVDNIPYEGFQKLLTIVDKMNVVAYQVYEGKKIALAAGDEAVQEQVGQGKDIMSVLCTYGFVRLSSASLIYLHLQ